MNIEAFTRFTCLLVASAVESLRIHDTTTRLGGHLVRHIRGSRRVADIGVVFRTFAPSPAKNFRYHG